LEIPVVFFIYNRPEKTRASFAALRAVRPRLLYVVADGPRDAADALRVAEARRVTEAVDWPCTVRRVYADENLTCGRRIATGLDAVFADCGAAIIVEDDIVATPAFFDFCAAMLRQYETDPRMMMVTGWNGLVEHRSDACQAFVSKYPSIWGWATWRRAWARYQFDPQWSPDDLNQRLERYFPDAFRRQLQRHVYAHRLWQRYQTWDFQWGLTIYYHQGLVVTPTVNLCRNIGFDAEGTHLTEANLRGLFPALAERFAACPPVVDETYGPSDESYDHDLLLVSLFSQYHDVRHLLLLYRHPHLRPAHQSDLGWDCSLQPFREPDRCLRVLDHLEPYVGADELARFRGVFSKLLPATA
jgi:hypothetical protein